MHIQISGQHVAFPPSCACCADKPDTELPLAKKQNSHWSVPFCEDCAAHVKAAQRADMAFWAGGGTAALIALLLGILVAPLFGMLFAIAGIMASFIARQSLLTRVKGKCEKECVGVFCPVAYRGASGAGHTFEIASPDFAYAFMVANQRNLAELSPQAKALLDARGNTAKARGR